MKHKDRPIYTSKYAAVQAAKRMQELTWQLYRIWRCVRCDGAWHVAAWDEYGRCAS